jgi:hypothetical protein
MAAVGEPQGGDPAVGIAREKRGRSAFALEDVRLDPLEGHAELGQEQAHLVAVAGD